MTFVRVFFAEWLKRRRSFASAMVLGGSLFTPAVVAVVRLMHAGKLPQIYVAPAFWPEMWRACWESMAVFFLPLGAILATSLVTQIEFRGNAWKQLHALPVSAAVIFLAKLTVILLMLVQFLVLFNVAIYAFAMLPPLIVPGVPRPKGSFASLPIVRENARYFLDCLPIVAAQYLMALRSNNILIPIGVGFLAWVGALAAVSSKAALWWPYAYTIVHYLRGTPTQSFALGFFVVLTATGYVMFATRAEKG